MATPITLPVFSEGDILAAEQLNRIVAQVTTNTTDLNQIKQTLQDIEELFNSL